MLSHCHSKWCNGCSHFIIKNMTSYSQCFLRISVILYGVHTKVESYFCTINATKRCKWSSGLDRPTHLCTRIYEPSRSSLPRCLNGYLAIGSDGNCTMLSPVKIRLDMHGCDCPLRLVYSRLPTRKILFINLHVTMIWKLTQQVAIYN